jgi:hypothetical protein
MVEKEADYCAHCFLAHLTLTLKVEVVHSSKIFSNAYQTAGITSQKAVLFIVTVMR